MRNTAANCFPTAVEASEGQFWGPCAPDDASVNECFGSISAVPEADFALREQVL
jgi:hypothetical protein